MMAKFLTLSSLKYLFSENEVIRYSFAYGRCGWPQCGKISGFMK